MESNSSKNNVNNDNIILRRTPSSPKINAKLKNNFNKTLSIFANKKQTFQNELTLETAININTKKERIQTSPQTIPTKQSEIITLNTENNKTEKETQNFLINHKVYFTNYSRYEQAKYSNKPYGSIAGYAANTNQGQVRNYNEDRVSIILNVIKPNSRQNELWPKVSFFGVYDGHGGNKCADFLKENLHHYVCKIFLFFKSKLKLKEFILFNY